MKPLNKRVNKRKSSKFTLKVHRKSSHPSLNDTRKEIGDEVNSIRPEDIKFHQNY